MTEICNHVPAAAWTHVPIVMTVSTIMMTKQREMRCQKAVQSWGQTLTSQNHNTGDPDNHHQWNDNDTLNGMNICQQHLALTEGVMSLLLMMAPSACSCCNRTSAPTPLTIMAIV